MVWALALGGMQDVGQNGPENEVNPLIDNGFMYTSDGWGTIYKIDARDPNHGEFVWVNDLGVRHEGNRPQTRGIALWDDLVIANLPDGRVVALNRDSGEIVWDKKVAMTNEFGTKERLAAAPLVAEGKVIVANGAGDQGTRGWVAALDVKNGNELWRWYAVPKPGEPGSETWKDKNNAWKTGGGGMWQTGSYDPDTKLTIWGTGNPVPQYDPESRPGDNLYTNSVVALDINTGKLVWYFQYLPNELVGLRRDRHPHALRRHDQRRDPQGGRSFRAQRLLLFARSQQRQLHQGRPVRERAELDQGPRSEDRQAGRVRSEARRAEIRSGGARVARRRHDDEAGLPDLARRRRAPADRLQPGQAHRLRRRRRGLLLAETAPRSRPSRARTAASTGKSSRSTTTPATSITARSPPTTRSTTRSWPRR